MRQQVTIQRKDGNDLITAGQAREHIEKSAEALRPHGLMYDGSAVIHFYKTPLGDQYEIASMTHKIAGMHERNMDAGLKELRRALMVLCGRKVD